MAERGETQPKPWWMVERIEQCQAEVEYGDSLAAVWVMHQAIAWWAFPVLFLIEASAKASGFWDWLETCVFLPVIWLDFIRKRPDIGRRVIVRR